MNPLTQQIQNATSKALERVDLYLKRKKNPSESPCKKPKHNFERAKWGEPLTDLFLNSNSTECIRCCKLETQLKENQIHSSELQVALAQEKQKNSELQRKLCDSERMRKLIHNHFLETKGSIRVFCRVKPTENSYISLPDPNLKETKLLTLTKNQTSSSFYFDKVFGTHTTQEEIFYELSELIQTALDGEHVCIFSYGQTGSGKTYTMEGGQGDSEGILPRAAKMIFTEIERQQNYCTLEVFVSCIEIYLDNPRDLLGDSDLKLRVNKDKLVVEGLNRYKVSTPNELIDLIGQSCEKRQTRETHLNSRSSRSHTIYQIAIEGSTLEFQTVKGKISLIDLAGSERSNPDTYSNKTSTQIETMKAVQNEAKYINTSLSCLRRVIADLVQRTKGVSTVPPFRETKLTRILQESLNQGKVAVIITVSPDNYYETKESLKFGSQAQMFK